MTGCIRMYKELEGHRCVTAGGESVLAAGSISLMTIKK